MLPQASYAQHSPRLPEGPWLSHRMLLGELAQHRAVALD